MLDRAKFLIISEVSEVMRETAPPIEGRVDQRARALLHGQGAHRGARAKVRQGGAARRPPRPPRRASRRPRVVDSRSPKSPVTSKSQKPAVAERPQRAFSFMIRRACSSPPSAPSPPTSPFPSTSSSPRRSACCWRCCSAGRASCTSSATAACGSALALRGITRSRRRPRAPAARPRRGLLREPPEQRRSADPVHGAAPADAHPLQGARSTRFRCSRARSGIGGFVPIDRRNKEAAMRSIEAGARVDPRGQLVPDLSRRHAQPDRRDAAVQEGRLHHGDQGAGADRAGGHLRAAAPRCSGAAGSSGPVTISIRVGEPIETAGMRPRRPRRADRDASASGSRRCWPKGPVG